MNIQRLYSIWENRFYKLNIPNAFIVWAEYAMFWLEHKTKYINESSRVISEALREQCYG